MKTRFRIGLLVSLVLVLFACGEDDPVFVTPNPTPTAPRSATPTSTPTPNPAQQACLDSGGQVMTITCFCPAPDFPNNCGIGGCTCPPTQSHQILSCDCGTGRCFDGTTCVSRSQPG